MFAPRVWSRHLRASRRRRPQLRAMSIAASQQIWHNGELIPWQSANVHILSTAVQFGMSMFEGIRKWAVPSAPMVLPLGSWARAMSMHSIAATIPGRLAAA